MDQGIIWTFKAYYPRLTFPQAIDATMEDHTIFLAEHGRNITERIQLIQASWKEGTMTHMYVMWQKLLLNCENNI